jgi:hypothetical protein
LVLSIHLFNEILDVDVLSLFFLTICHGIIHCVYSRML